MLLSRTTILGLLACLATQATSRPLEAELHAARVNSSFSGIEPPKPPPPPPPTELDVYYDLGDKPPNEVNVYDAVDGVYSEDEYTEGVDLNFELTRKRPLVHCTYSYNALYDWYVIKGEGWYPNDDDAMAEVKKCAKGAGLMTSWHISDTALEGGFQVEFRLPLGRRSSLLKRLGTQMYPPDGKRVGCKRVSRESQALFIDTSSSEKGL